MIYLAAIMIAALLVAGRVAHGRDWATKWLCFAPAVLIAAGVGLYFGSYLGILPVLAAILLFFSGATADNTLSYMYRVKDSSRWNIVLGYSWRVVIFCIALLALDYSLFYLLPFMIAPIWLVAWIASENRHITGEGEKDGKHRMNVEISEGVLAGINASAVWLALCL